MEAQTEIMVTNLIRHIESDKEPEKVLEFIDAELPVDTRHQVLALADVEQFFAQNVHELELGRKAFDQNILKEKAKIKVARSLMLRIMQGEGSTTVKSGRVTVSLRAGRERMKCVDPSKVTDEFARIKREGDAKKAMAAMHETGDIPDGFEFERGDPTVSILRK